MSCWNKNWKNILQELMRIYNKVFTKLPIYTSTSKGEAHNLEWSSRVSVEGYFCDVGTEMQLTMSSCLQTGVIFKKKVDSEQSAAKYMVEMLTLKFEDMRKKAIEDQDMYDDFEDSILNDKVSLD